MLDQTKKILADASESIVGLGEGPYLSSVYKDGIRISNNSYPYPYPTGGYDSPLVLSNEDKVPLEVWKELSEVMIERWKDFRRAAINKIEAASGTG